MRKKLVLLQVLAILIAVLQYGMRAAGQDEGITSSRIRFYPYLTARYVNNQVEMYQVMCPTPISTTAWGAHLNADFMCYKSFAKVKTSAYSNCINSSLQDTSWRFWC